MGFSAQHLGDLMPRRVGDDVFIVGNPGIQEDMYRRGYVRTPFQPTQYIAKGDLITHLPKAQSRSLNRIMEAKRLIARALGSSQE